jgi:hypothetical protein
MHSRIQWIAQRLCKLNVTKGKDMTSGSEKMKDFAEWGARLLCLLTGVRQLSRWAESDGHSEFVKLGDGIERLASRVSVAWVVPRSLQRCSTRSIVTCDLHVSVVCGAPRRLRGCSTKSLVMGASHVKNDEQISGRAPRCFLLPRRHDAVWIPISKTGNIPALEEGLRSETSSIALRLLNFQEWGKRGLRQQRESRPGLARRSWLDTRHESDDHFHAAETAEVVATAGFVTRQTQPRCPLAGRRKARPPQKNAANHERIDVTAVRRAKLIGAKSSDENYSPRPVERASVSGALGARWRVTPRHYFDEVAGRRFPDGEASELRLLARASIGDRRGRTAPDETAKPAIYPQGQREGPLGKESPTFDERSRLSRAQTADSLRRRFPRDGRRARAGRVGPLPRLQSILREYHEARHEASKSDRAGQVRNLPDNFVNM